MRAGLAGTDEVFEPITSAVDRLSVAEAGQGFLSKQAAERDYRSSQWRLGLGAVISLVAGLIIVLVLGPRLGKRSCLAKKRTRSPFGSFD